MESSPRWLRFGLALVPLVLGIAVLAHAPDEWAPYRAEQRPFVLATQAAVSGAELPEGRVSGTFVLRGTGPRALCELQTLNGRGWITTQGEQASIANVRIDRSAVRLDPFEPTATATRYQEELAALLRQQRIRLPSELREHCIADNTPVFVTGCVQSVGGALVLRGCGFEPALLTPGPNARQRFLDREAAKHAGGLMMASFALLALQGFVWMCLQLLQRREQLWRWLNVKGELWAGSVAFALLLLGLCVGAVLFAFQQRFYVAGYGVHVGALLANILFAVLLWRQRALASGSVEELETMTERVLSMDSKKAPCSQRECGAWRTAGCWYGTPRELPYSSNALLMTASADSDTALVLSDAEGTLFHLSMSDVSLLGEQTVREFAASSLECAEVERTGLLKKARGSTAGANRLVVEETWVPASVYVLALENGMQSKDAWDYRGTAGTRSLGRLSVRRLALLSKYPRATLVRWLRGERALFSLLLLLCVLNIAYVLGTAAWLVSF